MINFYTTHCPLCTALKRKLDEKFIKYEEITDTNIMRNLDITSVPVLEIDGNLYSYPKALKWIKENY